MNLTSECYSAIAGGGADAVAAFLAWLAQRRGLEPRLHALDVGCGPGRMFEAPTPREPRSALRRVGS